MSERSCPPHLGVLDESNRVVCKTCGSLLVPRDGEETTFTVVLPEPIEFVLLEASVVI